jgi:hypothetical protein
MNPLQMARAEVRRYEHPLLDFSVRDHNGQVELVIECKVRGLGHHTYYLPLHPRDFESPQFPWTFQRLLYDGMHDYIVEMFARTPQMKE